MKEIELPGNVWI